MVGSSSSCSYSTRGRVRRAFTLLTIAFALIIGAGVLCYESDDGFATVGDEFTVGEWKYKVLSDPSGETPGTVQIGDGENVAYRGSSVDIEIPSSVTHADESFSVVTIGAYAFKYMSSLKTATIPEGITHISDRAFFRCSNLESIIIPEGVASMGVYIFDGCRKLTSVTLPESLTTIGDYAFTGCSGLTSITLPANTTSVGDWVFLRCTSLTSVSVDVGNTVYKSVGGVVFSKDGTTLIHHPNGRAGTYAVPNGVTAINDGAFQNSVHLTSVSMPNSVRAIGHNAFNACTSLASVSMSPNVDAIGSRAFFGCESLESAPLVEGMKTIGGHSFYNCVSLTSVNIPASITSIPNSAFAGCSGMLEYVVDPANTKYSSNGGVLFNYNGTRIIAFPGGITGVYETPETVTEIGGYSFSGSNLHTLIISDSVTSIGADMITSSNISAIRIPGAITPLANTFSKLYRIDGTMIGSTAEEQADAIGRTFVKIDGRLTMTNGTSYAVTYDLDNGDGTAPVQEDVIGGFAFIVKDFDGTKTGYEFSGWSFGNGTYEAGDIVITGDAATTLTAIWTPITYAVSFDANGGASEMGNQIHTYGSPLALTPNTFTKNGYDFAGWNTASDGSGTSYADNASVSNLSSVADAEVALYAQWTPTSYTISYVLNGGVNSESNPSAYTVESTTVTFSPATRVGYTFGGWYSNAEMTTSVIEIASGSHGETTIYAKWTAIAYTVVFDSNTGTGTMANQAFTYDAPQNLTANAFTKTGCVFVRWATAADGTGDIYTDGSEAVNLSATNGSDVTLYAQWTDRPYEVTFHTMGGSDATKIVIGHGMTFDAPITTRTGYAVAGWFTEETYENEWDFETNVVDGNLALYVKWVPITYTLSFDPNSGSGEMANLTMTYDSSVELTACAFTRSGYEFAGWNLAADGTGASYDDGATAVNLSSIADSTVTLYAKWNAVQYTISYNLNGGGNSGSNPVTYSVESATIDLAPAAREGYEFAGWFSDAGFTSAKTSIPTGSTGGVTLFARWTAVEYTITYNLNGGGNSGSNPVTYTVESATIDLAPAAREGYEFAGWFSDAGFTSAKTSIPTGSTGDLTLFARWTAVEYAITYNLNGGENSESNPDEYTIESGSISFSPATRAGHAFSGWFSDEGLTTRAAGIDAGSMGAVSVYAKWTPLEVSEDSAVIDVSDEGDEAVIESEVADIISSKDVTINASSWKIEVPSEASAGLFDADVSVSIGVVDAETLPETIRSAIGNAPVFSLELMRGGSPFAVEFGAPVKITVKYTPSEGEDLSDIAVVCVNDDGTLGDRCEARYFTEGEQGYLEFSVPHFSYWMLMEVEDSAGSDSGSDDDGSVVPIVIGVVIGLAVIAGAAFFLIRRKNMS